MSRARGGALTVAVVAVGLVTASPAPLTAQTPADTARVLFNLGRDLLRDGDTTRAQSLFQILLRRFPQAAVAGDVRAVLDSVEAVRRDRGGRGELVGWSTVYGAALGLLIPAALGAEDSEAYGVGLLLGAPLGFAGSKSYANSVRLTPGQARAITFGSWWGMWQGAGWREVFEWGDGEEIFCGPTECVAVPTQSDRAPFTATVLGGLAGLTTGIVLSRNIDVSASTALVANFGALWGTWFAYAGSVIAIDHDGDGRLATALLGGDVGLLVGALAAPALRLSTGQAWLVHLSGIAGLIGGFGIDLIVQPDDDAAGVAIPAATSAFGLVVGLSMARNEEAGASGSPEMASALLSVRDGRLRLGMPLPVPAVLPAPARRRGVAPGVRLDLLRLSW